MAFSAFFFMFRTFRSDSPGRFYEDAANFIITNQYANL